MIRTTLLLSTILPLCVLANNQSVKVYSSPSIKAKSIGEIKSNDGYSILNDWVHISHKSLTGWVRIKDLKKAIADIIKSYKNNDYKYQYYKAYWIF